MRNDDDRRWLYDQMKKAGVDTGTYDDFTNSLNNPEDRDWYYNKSKSLGLEVGSSDDFISMMVADQEVPNTPNNQNNLNNLNNLNNPNTPKEKVEEIQPVETGDTTSGVLGNDTLSAMQEIGTPLQQQRGSLNDLEGHTDNYYRAQDDWKKQREEQRNATKDWYENQGGKEQTEAMQSQAEALVEQNKSGAQRFFDRRVEEGNVLAWMLGGVADIVNRWTNDDYGNARVVQERIEDTKNLIEEAERKVTTGEGQQLLASLRGAWNSAADIRTWDFGVNDATDIFNIGQALKKADQKQELTPSEEMLLNAVALTSELEDAYGEDVSMGYRVGQSVPQSAGFAASIALNPASGLGQSMAKAALRKYARTKFGPIGVRTIVNGIRFGGDALEALSTTLTTGLPRTITAIGERIEGQVMGAPMEDGTYRYIGHQSKDDSFAESAWKGFLSSYFENESEMLGEYLAPLKGFVGNMFARAAGDRAWAKKAVQWMTTSSDDEVTTLLNRMKGKAKINGLAGEYLEEVANNVADAAVIHDQNFSTDPNSKDWGNSVFNPEKNLETFLSVAAMIGPMKMVELGGRGYNQYSANQTLKAREQLMKDVYGKDNDNGQYIVDQFSECKDWKEMSQKFTQLKNEQMISDEREARAVLGYLSALVESQTVNTRYQSKKYHSERIGDQSKEAYDAGLGMKLQDYHKANLQYAPAKQQAHDMFGDDMAEAMVQMTPWEFNNVRMRMSPEQRQVAEAYYNQASRMKGILDKENADVNAHMDYFRNSYAPYVKRVANGDDFLMRAKYTDPLHPEAGSEDVVLLSRDGGTATILLNGKPAMVNTNTLSEFTSQTWREAQEEERNSFAKQKEQQRQWGLDHNPKTQMPYAGSTIKISSGEAGGGMSEYVTDFDMQNGMVGIVPMQFDAKAGQEVPLSTEVLQVPLEVVLHLQDQYYDGLEGMSAQNTPSNPNTQNTQNTPSEETEEGAGMAPGAAEAQLRGTQGGQQTLQQVQDWMNAGEDPETIERNIQTQIEEDYRDLALQYYREKSTPQAEPAGTAAGIPQAEPAGTVAGENGGEATAPTAPELRGKNGQLDRAMMEQNGDPQTVASALRGDFPDDAADIASEYQVLAQQEADSETEPIAKRVRARAAKFWQDVLNLLRPIAQGGPTAAEIRAQAQIEATEEAKKNFPKIVERWQNAPKKVGRKTIYRLPDGTRITGHYVLTESGAYTPSHDPHTFKPNEGFPTTDQGTTANSRDYEHDEAAQQQVVVMGQSYNGNALQDPVVVSQDGIVYSGNNRAMSGQLAAEQGTDTDYLEDLGIRAEEYGFTEEDIAGMQHPRVVFVADAGQDLDYTPKTFDRFNAQRGKGQSATEKAIKFGKILDETTFGNLVSVITKRNKLSDVYKSAEDCKAIADYLEAAGVMTSTQRVEFLDSKGLLTSQGQEALEGALIGYVFKGNEQVVRLLNQMPAVRRRIIGAINEIVTNRSLGEYSLDNELGDAIQLLYEADQSGMDLGSFYKQTDFTRDVQGLYNATTYLLATMLDGTSQKSLKDVLQSYNTGADTQISNFGGLFGGMNRQELLEDILKALGYELRTRQGTGQEDTGGQTPSAEEGTDEGVGENEVDNEDDNDDDNDDDGGGENNGPKGGGTGNNSVPLPTEGETYVNSRNGERAVITGEENGTLTVEYHTPEGDIVTDTVNAEEFAQDVAYGEWTKENPEDMGENEDDNDGESGAEEELTAEQIRNSGADPVYIGAALGYLEESVHDNSLTRAAYEYIKQLLKEQGNVRTGQDTGETGSEDADSTHLGSEDNGAAEGGIRQDGMEAGGLVDGTSQDTGFEPDGGGSRQGGTTAEGSDTSATGEGSSSDAGGRRTPVDGVSSGNSQPRGGRGSRNGGRDVRQPEGGEGSNGAAEPVGAGSADTAADLDAEIASLIGEIDDILTGKKDDKDVLGMAVLPFQTQMVRLMKAMPTIVKVGYKLLRKGYHNLERWTEQMHKSLDAVLEKAGFKAKEIANAIKDCWNTPIEVDGRMMKISDWAHEIRLQFLMREQGMSLNEKRAAQEAAEGIQVKVCDRENIDATLPFLMEAQREDVYKAEKQFFDPTHQDDEHCHGKGMLFTNATGTGKTYVGLGIIKRFVKQGKGRILLIVPSEAKERDWANRDAVNLGLTITPLRDLTSEESVSATNRKGQGIVVTTFENFRDNAALLEDDFDLILSDECHKLMQNQKGQETEASKRFHMITNRDVDTAKERLKYVHPLWVEERNLQDEEASINSTMRSIGEDPSLVPEGETYYGYIDRLRRRVDEIHNRLYELRAEQQRVEPTLMPRAQEAVNRTHVVLLSATPFSTREALRWAGGYIFNLPNGNFDDFLLRWFPESYRREGGKARPKLGDALQVNREEIAFSDRLMNELGTQSGRVSEVPFDYSRDFPVMDLVMASAFNQAYQAITRGKYFALLPGFTMLTNYESSTVLFETLKVAAVLPRIREHLAMGRKVAIYHSRRNDSHKDPISPPFRAGLDKITKLADQDPDRDNKQRIYALVQEFEQEFANLLAWELTLDYRLPREQLADAFGADNVGFFSGASEDKRKGSEKDQRRFVDVRKFNSDDSGKDIIVCQTQSAREGIDLHDTTGKHQRVLMVLSLPTSSIEFIQIEGRIFRIGTRSNAIFEYPLLGIDLELQVFAAKINSRAATTENLALGSKARNLRQSIADGILQGRGIIPVASQGIGGKEFDNPKSVLSGIAKAIADYVNRMKGHTDKSEKDSTPEPLGYTLVQWAGMNNGDRVLEPSAGRGNIARYIPAFVKGLFLESDAAKRADLMLATAAVDKDDENAGRFNFNASGEPFENLTSNRKFDSIVMVQPANDEFSTTIKVAFGRNLENSGRLVAVVPTKQVNQLRKDMKPQGAVFVAYAVLPEVAYEDPSMKDMTVVVIDKVQREDIRSQYPKETAVLDFSGCKTMEEFFEELKKEPQVPPRIIDPLTKRIKRGEALMNSLKNNPIVEESGRGQNKSEWANFSPTTGSFYFVPKNRSRNKGENVYHLMSQRARYTYGYISSRNRGSLNYGVIENIGKEANNLAARIYVAAKDAMDKYDANNLAAYRQEVFGGNEVADDICAGMYRYQKALCRYIEEVSGLTEDQIRRAEAGESIFTHSILAPGRKLSSREFRSIFDDNSSGDAEMAEHFGIVFPLIKKEGTGLVTGRTTAGSAATYSPRTNTVSLNASVWNRLGREKLDNAVVLLHEMTHMPVAYARTAFEAGLNMGETLRGLCESLDNLFGTIMKSRESYHLKGEYGLSDADELISESSDPKVREKMKRVSLWKKSANGVIKYRVFEAYDTPEEAAQDGYSRTNAYAEAMNLLQGFVNNHDLELAKLVSPMYEGTGEWGDTDAALEEASGRFKTDDRSNPNTRNNPREVEQAVEETSQVLNTPIEILRNEQELEASDISAADKKVMRKKGKGMYDTKTGKVYIYLPHLRSADDARVTALHEIVGHKGLRQLFGEKDFDQLMARLFGLLPREARDLIMSRCKTEEDIPTEVDEYLAEMAELDENPSWWQKVVSAVKEFLRSKGLNIGLSENDVKYLLWQSKNQLKSGDLFTEAQRIRMRKKYGIGENDNDDDDPDGGGGGGRYQAEREGGQILILPSEEEAGALSSRTSDLISEGKDTESTLNPQENSEENEDFDEEDPVGENTSRFSTGRSTTATANATARQWDKIVQSLSFGLTEVTADYLHAVERFQKFLADKTGKAVLYTQDVYNAMLQLSSRNSIETKKFDEMFVTPLNLAILDLLGNKVLVKSWRKWVGTGKLDFEKNPELQALDRYVKMKHGVERNRDMSVRNVLIPRGQQAYQDALDAALKPYRDDLERIEQELENNEAIIENLKQELQALRASRAGSSAIQAKKDELERARETSARLRSERAEDRRMIRDITKHPHNYGLKTLSESIEDELKSWYEAAQQVKENARANGKSWRETQEALDKEALKIPDVVLEDYSGLSAMTGDGIVFTQKAYDEVEKYEFDKDADKLQHLWAAISAIADFSMLKQQESGLVGEGYFDQQKRRFDYFVPLRGWQEMTAEDVYEYVNEVNTELGNPVKAMKGRQSEAGNAFGSLLNVAYGSINHGNRNEALTKFYNLVQGHPTDIARISGGWLERIEDPDGGPDLWVAREVELDGTETEEEMIQKIDAFESEMQEKAENGDAMRDSQHGAKVPYRITKPGTLNQHQIRIHINGRTRIITIGANPRVTEALNGLLNPSISNNMFVQGWKKVKNIKAGLLTAMSINFAQGNLDRDTSFAMVNSYVRYGGAFAKAFAKHQGAYFFVSGVGARPKWAEMGHLLRLYNKNSLNESNPLHQQFKEFMDYGGATGYTFLVNMEQSKKKLEDTLRQLNRGALHPGTFAKAFRDFVELVTQSSELTNRFSAFQAGKDLGWTRGQCIAAAKEITANFNRKGAGTKGARKNDENKARQKAVNLAASATDVGNALNLFFNASIQGKYALWLALKSHPAKGAAVAIGVPIALGMLMPLVNDMFLPMLYAAFGWDDYPPEDENYWDFNDYNRQHNIRIRLPKKLNILGHQTPKGWLKFSISQELTPFFSVGDVIAGSMYGGRELQASDLVQPFVDLVSPVNVNVDKMNGVKGVLRDMAGGTPFSEIVDVGLNKDFMGRPVYKETYNKQQAMAPNYTKGLKRTSPALTDFTKWLNNKSGGNEVKAGRININPAIAEHLSGALGGYFKLPMDFIDMAYAGYKGEELKGSFLENTALFKRNYDSGAQDAVDRRISGKYYELVDAMDKLHYEEKGYEKAQREANQKANSSTDSYVQAEELSKADKMRAERDKLVNSDDYQFYISIKREMDFIKKLEDQEKKTGITNETIPEKKRALLEQWKEWKKRQ